MVTDALLHPFTVASTPEDEMVSIVAAEGCTLTDENGKTYIDSLGSLWLCQIGHGNETVIGAMKAQLDELVTYNLFEPFSNPRARQVAEEIRMRSPIRDGRVFLGCSGSEAVDSALKLSRRVHQLRGDTDRQMIVRRQGGFHGTNVGGTSVQGIEPIREGWGDLLAGVVEIPADDVEPAAQLFAEHGERIAAVITEPIQGAGGVIMPPDGYLEGLRRLCDQHGALLIFDEVICGFGRTGEWFASQTFGVTPDLFTFAKGVTSGYAPLSGVVISRAMADTLETDSERMLHGYTYSGHPVSCAAGIANIGVIEDEGLIERARHIEKKMTEGFDALVSDGLLTGYRGIGGLWAAVMDRDGTEAKKALLERGVVTRSIGNTLAFCPPLIITDEEIGTVMDRLADALRVG